MTLGDILTPDSARPGAKPKPGAKVGNAMEGLLSFMNVAIMYGSDEVVETFSNFRRSASANPPGMISVRLIAEFMLAIRRDLDGGTSKLGALEMVGMRINDLDSNREFRDALTMPLDELYRIQNWTPPWSAAYVPPNEVGQGVELS